MKKRKRQTTENLKSRKPDYRNVKTSLKSIIRNPVEYEKINDTVLLCHNLVTDSYLFVRCYILSGTCKYISNLDETFFLYALKTVGIVSRGRPSKLKHPEMNADVMQFYMDDFTKLLSRQERLCLDGLSHVLPYLAKQMLTAYHNNIKEHFVKRLFGFVNKTVSEYETNMQDVKKKRKLLKNAIFTKSNVPEYYNEWARKHLNYLIPEDVGKGVPYDVKVNPNKYIPCMIYMNRLLEETDCKLFQPLPIRTCNVPCHIRLDTACLIDLLVTSGKSYLLRNIEDIREKLWSDFFFTKKRIFYQNGYDFNYMIETDGLAVSLLFKKSGLKKGPKFELHEKDHGYFYLKELSDEQLSTLSTKKIVGVDPGKFNLVYMVDEQGNKLRYTAHQRRFESKSGRNHKIFLKEKKKYQESGISLASDLQEAKSFEQKTFQQDSNLKSSGVSLIDLETSLSKCNSCTVNYEKFLEYVRTKSRFQIEYSKFYERIMFRKMRWRQYVNTKRSEQIFMNKIEKMYGKDILLAYGDWSRPTQMKHFMPTIGSGLRKILSQRFETVSVNEFRTSKLCCNCQNQLEYYKVKGSNKKVFRCLICKECKRSESNQTVFLTRDFNSANNILNNALSILKIPHTKLFKKQAVGYSSTALTVTHKRMRM